MAEGRRRQTRRYLIQQAALVWYEGKSDELIAFIETGSLGGNAQGVIAPYNPMVLQMLQDQIDKDRAVIKAAKEAATNGIT